ncbi:MAG: phosphoenolpyruvate carboxykinase domain-containing protein, partial [Microbacteriaceae bacterium]
ANVSPVGSLPKLGDLQLQGLDINIDDAHQILTVDSDDIRADALDAQKLLDTVGDTVPRAVRRENERTLTLCD